MSCSTLPDPVRYTTGGDKKQQQAKKQHTIKITPSTHPSVWDGLVGRRCVVILVHADWCMHCRELLEHEGRGKKSVWQKVKDGNKDTLFMEIEADAAKQLVADALHQKTLLARVLGRVVKGYPCIVKVLPVTPAGVLPVTVFNASRTPEVLDGFVKA